MSARRARARGGKRSTTVIYDLVVKPRARASSGPSPDGRLARFLALFRTEWNRGA